MNREAERQNGSILKELWIAQELGKDWSLDLDNQNLRITKSPFELYVAYLCKDSV